MILRTDRLNIVSLNYEQAKDYTEEKRGFIKTDENKKEVMDYTIIPMSEAPVFEHLFYTIWIGFYEGKDILQCGFLRPVNEHKVVEIWIHVNDECQNQGFGSEAITALVEWAKTSEKIDFVGASVEELNEASKRMLLKCGFEYACISQEMEIYFYTLKNND